MKNIFIEEREIRQPKLIHALITFGGLIAVMAVGIIVFEVDPHIPMFIGVIISAVMAMYLGYNWSQIEKMMVDGISKAMQSARSLRWLQEHHGEPWARWDWLL